MGLPPKAVQKIGKRSNDGKNAKANKPAKLGHRFKRQ
jgi:hypothetical protein